MFLLKYFLLVTNELSALFLASQTRLSFKSKIYHKCLLQFTDISHKFAIPLWLTFEVKISENQKSSTKMLDQCTHPINMWLKFNVHDTHMTFRTSWRTWHSYDIQDVSWTFYARSICVKYPLESLLRVTYNDNRISSVTSLLSIFFNWDTAACDLRVSIIKVKYRTFVRRIPREVFPVVRDYLVSLFS